MNFRRRCPAAHRIFPHYITPPLSVNTRYNIRLPISTPRRKPPAFRKEAEGLKKSLSFPCVLLGLALPCPDSDMGGNHRGRSM